MQKSRKNGRLKGALLRKNEKAEDIIISQNTFIENISSQIYKSQKRLEEIDEKGIFQGDDDIDLFPNKGGEYIHFQQIGLW